MNPMTNEAASAEPGLFELTPSGTPVLYGVRCAACEFVMHPEQHLGCERCGAFGDELERMELSGRGTVNTSAVVYRHPVEDLAPPFVIAEIRLDEGPLVRGVLAADAPPAPQVRVRATAQRIDQPSARWELRFAQETSS